jgi:hypothetical protein
VVKVLQLVDQQAQQVKWGGGDGSKAVATHSSTLIPVNAILFLVPTTAPSAIRLISHAIDVRARQPRVRVRNNDTVRVGVTKTPDPLTVAVAVIAHTLP